jgi:hypothetical protein
MSSSPGGGGTFGTLVNETIADGPAPCCEPISHESVYKIINHFRFYYLVFLRKITIYNLHDDPSIVLHIPDVHQDNIEEEDD